MAETRRGSDRTGLEIAVIGMAGRFPGARNIDEFWENLEKGVESIAFFSDDELKESGIDEALIRTPGYVKAKGVLEDIEYFDALFFDYLPEETELMDPQMRIFHECAWEALEHAGYDPKSYGGLIGLYAGLTPNFIWAAAGFIQSQSSAKQLEADYLNGNFFSTLISYKLNLKGPSITVQTACSTSLVAIHQACRALLTGECHMALAGGVTITLPKKYGYLYAEGMIHSPDGHCRAFDAGAGGIVGGNGIGIVLLKTLDEASSDRDVVHAVIKGTAVNNDGNRKIGYTAPSVEGQVAVIKAAHQVAEIEVESIGYVEAHGTGTVFGDPIEVEALKKAFNSERRGFCGIGSVKTNVGHLDSAAGVAGFIKTVLTLKHRQIPASLNFEAPNSKIDFDNSPFFVNNTLRRWKNDDHPLRAAVSSFGIGGTNAHVVLEEAPEDVPALPGEASPPQRPYKLILLSALSEAPLEKAALNLADHLEKNPRIDLADAAYTLQVGRPALACRRMVIGSDTAETVEILRSPGSTGMQTFRVREENRPVVFMFPGQGAQYVNMGLGLYRWEPVFRQELDRCFRLLEPLMGMDLKEILFPGSSRLSGTAGEDSINRTAVAQPLLFSFEYALARWLEKLAVVPRAMVGHSIGEYVAACLSGVFNLEDGLRLAVQRGRLMQQLPAGAMLSVPLAEKDLKTLLTGDLDLAAVNGPCHCVVSGPHEAVAALEETLRARGERGQLLHTSHAFHSAMMDPVLDAFAGEVEQIKLNKPEKPYLSNLSGTWITVEDAVDPGYWARHLRQTVRFADGLAELLKERNSIFLEIGPGRSLATLVRQYRRENSEPLVLNLVRHPQEDVDDDYHLLNKIGQLWLQGKKIDWRGFYSEEKRWRVSLPAYPFERRRFWKNAEVFKSGLETLPQMITAGKNRDLSRWFYVPSWKRSLLPMDGTNKAATGDNWLVFVGPDDFGQRLVEHLQRHVPRLVTVRAASGFNKISEREYAINPCEGKEFEMLFRALRMSGYMPSRLVHMWCLNEDLSGELDVECIDRVLELGFYSLLNIARSLGKLAVDDAVQMMVVSNNMHEVTGREMLRPESASLLGPVRIIPREYPGFACRNVDFLMPGSDDRQGTDVIEQLYRELNRDASDMVVAYRDTHRWVQTFEPYPLTEPGTSPPRLRSRGTYLITGGLGGIGLVLAEHLARSVEARLVLIGRSAFPPREEWAEWLDRHGSQDSVGLKIKKLVELEAMGAEVSVFSADVADYERMRQVLALVEQKYGRIHGVIHAAGLPGGGVIQGTTSEKLAGVLAPKVKGTLVLDTLLKSTALDFFIMCSSLNSILAVVGQAGYCAANSFLDIFAPYRTLRRGEFTLSVNWDAWQEVGMAVKRSAGMDGEMESSGAAPKGVEHPLFDFCKTGREDEVIYVSHLTVKQWVLEEHRVMGKATLPGTALLEMARGAWADHNDREEMELRKVFFFNPLVVEDDEEREVHTVLKKLAGGFDFVIKSRANSAGEGWIDHARGQIKVPESHLVRRHNVAEIRARCSENEVMVTDELMALQDERDGHELQFGPRWHNIKKISYGTDEVLVHLELPEIFEEDTRFFKLHPALLDAAVGSFREEDTDRGLTLPFSYKRMRIKAPLPRKIFSHIRYLETNRPGGNFLNYDVTVLDEHGRELVEIEEYSRLAMSGDARSRMLQPSASAANRHTTPPDTEALLPSPRLAGKGILEYGISSAEGVAVFDRLLASPQPQILVSTLDLPARLKQNDALNKTRSAEGFEGVSRQEGGRPRPQLGVPFVEPGDEVELKLARIWQEFLGIEKLGIHDDFFELGGDSLKVINIIPRIHRALDVEIPLAEFFNHPNIGGIAAYINKAAKSEHARLEIAEKKEYYKLSSAQKRLYMLHQVDMDSTAYNLAEMVVVKEESFEPAGIETLFGKLVARHESLRTRFEKIDGEPVQIIEPEIEFKIDYFDAGADSGEGSVIVDGMIKNFIKPFILHRAPLLRVCLLKVDSYRFVLMIDLHHIIADGLSLAIILREFRDLYRERPLPRLNVRYIDYSEWHNRDRLKEAVQAQQTYWLNEFRQNVPVLNLPRDFERPAIMSFEGDKVGFEFDEKETRALRNLALGEEVTLFMLLLAVYAVLLAKLSGQEDIVVGSPVAGRRHEDLEGIVGMFVNTLVLRIFPREGLTFKAFLHEVKEKTLQAFQNQDFQFEDLVDAVVVNRDMSRNPLFDVMLILQNLDYPVAETTGAVEKESGANGGTYKFDRRTTRFELNLMGFESGERLVFSLEYCTKLFRRERIEWFARYFKDITSTVLENPGIELTGIDFIDEAERDEIISQFIDDL